jgi:cell division protein FtsB
VVLIGSAALVFVVGAATVRESYRGWKVDSEIRALEQQANDLEGRNAQLRNLAQTLQSPDRLEVEARSRLAMRQPGEHVVVLNGFSSSASWPGRITFDVVAEKPVVKQSNPELWWSYFFHPSRLHE